MEHPALIDHILFILFGIILPANAVLRSQPMLRQVKEWTTPMKVAFYRGNNASLWVLALIVIITWLIMGRSLAALGFRLPMPATLGQSLLVALAFSVAYALDVYTDLSSPEARARTRRHWQRNTPFMPEDDVELRHFWGVAFSAAVCEEILFRGYFITYLLALLGPAPGAKILAITIPTVIFALSHYYQGWKAVAKIAALSLAFGLIFLVSQSLLIPIILHFLVDAVSGRISPLILRSAGEEEE